MTESFCQLLTLVTYAINIRSVKYPNREKKNGKGRVEGRSVCKSKGGSIPKKKQKPTPKLLTRRVRTRGFELCTFLCQQPQKLCKKDKLKLLIARNTTDGEPVGNITQLPCELVYIK